MSRSESRYAARVAKPRGGNSEYLIGRQKGLVASVNAGRMSFTRLIDGLAFNAGLLSGLPNDYVWLLQKQKQSALSCKAQMQKNIAAGRCSACPAHAADYRLHVVEIALQRPAPGGCQTVFGPGRSPLERLRTGDIAGLFKLARMHTQIPVAGLYRMLEFVKGQRIIYRERADNSQSEPFVDQSIDLVHAQGRTAVDRFQPLLFGPRLFCFVF